MQSAELPANHLIGSALEAAKDAPAFRGESYISDASVKIDWLPIDVAVEPKRTEESTDKGLLYAEPPDQPGSIGTVRTVSQLSKNEEIEPREAAVPQGGVDLPDSEFIPSIELTDDTNLVEADREGVELIR